MFTVPLAFLGLLAVPALAAIYLFRSSPRRLTVSSLILWQDPHRAREVGLKVKRMQTPLLFFLEILTILFLVIAAAGPAIHRRSGTRALVVVLDGSFSMLAGGSESAKSRAKSAVEQEIRDARGAPVHFVLAGRQPQVLAEPTSNTAQAIAVLKKWRARAPLANLEQALALASKVAGTRSRILVLTDCPPPQGLCPEEGGRVQWWAFGRPLPNVAFVNAARTRQDRQEYCLLEVANLSPDAIRTTLMLEGEIPVDEPPRRTLKFRPGETKRVMIKLSGPGPPRRLRAMLGGDALAIDNEITLLPLKHKPVRVDVQIADTELRESVEKALNATRRALITTRGVELLLTDRKRAPAAGPQTWTVQFFAEQDALAYIGPFVIDRSHPLAEGLALEGVVWAAGKTERMPGTAVISAGNVPLLSDKVHLNGRHELRIRLQPKLSTLQESPNWPVLIWNLLQYRASDFPGLQQANLRLGTEAVLTLKSVSQNPVTVTTPDGRVRLLRASGKKTIIDADDVGLFQVKTEQGETFTFASNALCRDESDLTQCTSGRWGNWLDEAAMRTELLSIAWLFLLLALATLTAHMVLHQRGAEG